MKGGNEVGYMYDIVDSISWWSPYEKVKQTLRRGARLSHVLAQTQTSEVIAMLMGDRGCLNLGSEYLYRKYERL